VLIKDAGLDVDLVVAQDDASLLVLNVTTSQGVGMALFDAKTGVARWRIPVGEQLYGAIFDSYGGNGFVTGMYRSDAETAGGVRSPRGAVWRMDSDSGAVSRVIDDGVPRTSLVRSWDGNTLFMAGHGDVEMLDTRAMRITGTHSICRR
jgi:hypothetical protein